jgi:hypothetical protein
LSDVFDETLQRQECSAFKQKLEDRIFWDYKITLMS